MKRGVVVLCGIFLFALIVLQFTSADVIQPGQKIVPVINVITNMNNFTNYTLISVCNLGRLSQPKLVADDGTVSSDYYKFCSVEIWAIRDDKLNFNLSDYDRPENNSLFQKLSDAGAAILAKGLRTAQTLSESDPTDNITKYYSLDDYPVRLISGWFPDRVPVNESVNTENESPINIVPDKVERNMSPYAYLYIIIPIVAIIVILLVIFFRKKNE